MLDKSQDPAADNKPDPEDLCDVFVLKTPVREGMEILPENILVVQLCKSAVPRGVVKTFQQMDGRAAKSEIPRKTVLLDEYFVQHITPSPAKGFIPPGFHAVRIRIHEVATDGPSDIFAVQPGDQVDIIVVHQTLQKDDPSDEFVLLEKIPVIDTFWEEAGDIQRNEKKGTVSILLSDSQRKNLEEEYQSAMKIRLRICSPVGTQTAGKSQLHGQADLVTRNLYQSDNQPPLISQSLKEDASPIEIVFRNKQELQRINQDVLQIPSFHGIPAESYADVNAENLPVSANDKTKSVVQPDLSLSGPRYSSFFDAAGGRKGNSNPTPWRAVVPRSPLVFEARPILDTQARGVYRDGGVYYSVE